VSRVVNIPLSIPLVSGSGKETPSVQSASKGITRGTLP
jgi:hypothetical protein